MAQIGLKYIVGAKYAEAAGTVTYTTGAELAQAIKADIKITTYNEKLYANDGVRENMIGFQNGTLTLNVDDLDQAAHKTLFSGTETSAGITGTDDSSAQELVSSVSDTPPELGVGFYITKRVGGVTKYRALWFPRVQFSSPDESADTKGEAIKFGTSNIVGTILYDANKAWKKEVTVTTEASAVAWLKAKASITA